jgi:hypothetical protein
MAKALSCYASPVRTFDSQKMSKCGWIAWRKFSELSSHASRRLLTFKEACEGDPAFQYIHSVARGKSPGYPYNTLAIRNKTHFFGSGDTYDFTRPEALELERDVARTVECAKLGLRRTHVFTDFLKDELRSSTKVSAGQTRLVSASPVGYTVAWRMYFGAWMDAAQTHRLESGTAVGVNHNTEWSRVSQLLRTHGPDVFAGDFKSWDGSMQPGFHRALRDFINDWYDDGLENRRIRDVLWEEVSFSRHLGGTTPTVQTIYQWFKNLASGHPATSLINSFVNLLLWVLVWEDVVGPNNTHLFWTFVFVLTYGDDNIANVHPSIKHLFNMQTVTSAFSTYGMVYTDEDKTSDSATLTKTLERCSFLKRGFRYDLEACSGVGTWTAPLALETLLYIPYWVHSASRLETIMREGVENLLAELSLHEPLLWEQYWPLVSRACRDLIAYTPLLGSRSAYQALMLDNPTPTC